MLDEEQLYYLALDALIPGLSADRNFDLDLTESVTERWSRRWSMRLHDLDESLMKEQFTRPKSKPMPYPIQRMEKLADSINIRWHKVLDPAARDAYLLNSAIGEKEWLYFYCCRSMAAVLDEFDHLMQDSIGRSSDIYRRYETYRAKCDSLAQALLKEAPALDGNQRSLLEDINAKAELLAAEWRLAVSAVASEEHPSQE